MSVEFAVGKKVVCIHEFRDRVEGERHGIIFPRKGDVLTIRTIVHGCCKPGIFFTFEELPNEPLHCAHGLGEPDFASRRFRPVRETSIDCFTALLAKPPVRLREDA